MTVLEERLGHHFRDRTLLETALTHSSYANESREACLCNERLEFLGDSVLGVTVAEHLYRSYPDMPEGRMTRLRAELVCEQSLYLVAKKLDLGRYLRLGKGDPSDSVAGPHPEFGSSPECLTWAPSYLWDRG